MSFKNVFYGLFLCNILSLAYAGNDEVFTLSEEDLIERQERLLNYGNLEEINAGGHPYAHILDQAHGQVKDEEVKFEEVLEVASVEKEAVGASGPVQVEDVKAEECGPAQAEGVKSDIQEVAQEPVQTEVVLSDEPTSPATNDTAPSNQEVVTLSDTGSTEQESAPQEDNKSDEPTSPATSDNAPSNQEEVIVPAPKDDATSEGFALLSIKEASKEKLFALTAGAMFVGYCCYKVWNMLTASVEDVKDELNIVLTHQDRDILFTLLQAMGQDIENLRENRHEACAVSQVDISALSEILAPECKIICSNFVELYNAIDASGNNIQFIIMFYAQFEHSVQALLEQAEII